MTIHSAASYCPKEMNMNQVNNEEMNMKFIELPLRVQYAAIETLKNCLSGNLPDKGPAKEMARTIGEAFIELYSQSEQAGQQGGASWLDDFAEMERKGVTLWTRLEAAIERADELVARDCKVCRHHL